MLRVVISNNLSFKISSLVAMPSGDSILELVKKKFTYKNPDYVEARKYGRSTWNIEEFIYTFHILGDEIKIARGGIRKLTEVMSKHKIPIDWVNYTLVCEPISLFKKALYELREEDQIPFIEALYAEFKKLPVPQGIALAQTSFGKTFASIYLMDQIAQPILVLVHTTFAQKQWIDELVTNFGVDKKDIGGAGGIFVGKPKVGKINVALYHSMSKREINLLFRDVVGFLLIDEVQKLVIKQFLEALKHFRARYRLGVSADYERKDGKSFVILDYLGDVLYVAAEGESNSKIFSNIFGTRSRWAPVDSEGYMGHISEAGKDEERNILIAKSAVRKIKEDKIVVIFVERKEQAAALAKYLSKFRVHLLIGKVPPKEIAEMGLTQKAKDFLINNNNPEAALDVVKELALKRELDVVIATQKGEVGLSIETFDHGIVTTPVGNNLERFNQLKGRLERQHKGERLEKFGEKATPTVEIIVDNWDSSFNSWSAIKDKYKQWIIKNPYLVNKG